jgi:hypothetical protein
VAKKGFNGYSDKVQLKEIREVTGGNFTARAGKNRAQSRKIKKTGLKGFEPLTCGLRVRRYAELSYRPKPVDLIMWSIMPNKCFGDIFLGIP